MSIGLNISRSVRQLVSIALMVGLLVWVVHAEYGGPVSAVFDGYMGPLWAIAFFCAAWIMLFAVAFFVRIVFSPSQGLFVNDRKLVFIESWYWSLAIDEIVEVGLTERSLPIGKDQVLTFQLKNGALRSLPIGLLRGDPSDILARVRSHSARFIELHTKS